MYGLSAGTNLSGPCREVALLVNPSLNILVNPSCFLPWKCSSALRDYNFTNDSKKFKQQIHANRCGNVFKDLNILFLAVELWINSKGSWWLLDRKIWPLILPKIWWNISLLYFHYTLFSFLAWPLFFCLLIFSFI